MSIETVKAFFVQADSDPSLCEKFRSAALDSAEAVSRLGREHGYIFSPEDAMAAFEDYESGELSDEDLDLVSAGGSCPQYPSGQSDTGGGPT
ncbi:Nif11-like leader peptide family natural product precursor [uncultured Aureimonas sp.]|uniref:Nif11-like leader peptide family natural product precursor n=1 Tax=uncultured Aureimonas sp. TaxID=1604662 RepID=UPI0025FBEAEA|nr:Nif11-like leader peptide family natural product precursor [uncultured Aureimonas sp.]